MTQHFTITINGQDFACTFLHISYSCPALALRGFATERQLGNAIRRHLKKKAAKS